MAALLQMHVTACIRNKLLAGEFKPISLSEIRALTCLFISVPSLRASRPGLSHAQQVDAVQHVVTQARFGGRGAPGRAAVCRPPPAGPYARPHPPTPRPKTLSA